MAVGLLASPWLPNWIDARVLFAGGVALLVIGVLVALARRYRQDMIATLGLCLAAFAVSSLFALERADELLERRLPLALHGVEVHSEVEVASSVVTSGLATRFDAEVRSLSSSQNLVLPAIHRVRVTWFDAAATPVEGDIWSFKLKLRVPIGTLNDRSFDYEAWLLANQTDALASVRSGTLLARSTPTWDARTRTRLRTFIESSQPSNPGSLIALAFGDGAMMRTEQWRLFRDTGTVHLMVISGLHLGLVAFYAGLVGLGAARLVPPLCERVPAQVVGVLCGMGGALAFAVLCGWSLPVQRAFIMICCAGAALLVRRPFALINAWLVALILALCLNPFAPLASGFWLSFGAVGLLMLMTWNARKGGGLRHWAAQLARTQVLLSLGMSPLLLITVSELPLVSPLANLLAVPVTTLLIVPLILLTNLLHAVSPDVAGLFLWLADSVFSAQMWALEHFAAWPRVSAVTFNPIIAAVCLASFLCAFVPASWPLRLLLMAPGVMVALLLMPSAQRLPQGEFQLRVFDVGQGLSVLVETHEKSLLFDAGASFAGDFDFGDAVVVPEVRLAGWRRMDRFW